MGVIETTVNEDLAGLANVLLYGAMASYTGAFLAYTTDLAGGTSRAEAGQAQTSTAAMDLVTVTAGIHSATTDLATGTAATAVGDASGASDSAKAKPSAGSAGMNGRQGPKGWGGRRAASIGTALTLLAAALHVTAVVLRGVSASRPPWGNMFEFSTAGAAVVTVLFLAALRWRDLRYLGAFVVGPVLLTLGLAVTVFYTESAQLVPALESVWLAIHVSVAFIASALLTLAFSLTVLYLVQDRREQRRAQGSPVGRAFMDGLPPSGEIDLASYRLHAIAFPLWTFTLVAGAIWAENAWGRYWGWDPKEVWTFVIWVVYAGYLHARATRGWQGRKAAWLAITGFVCVVFNFTIVNIFFVGFHSYGGVG